MVLWKQFLGMLKSTTGWSKKSVNGWKYNSLEAKASRR
jgi:hypothetical protein